MINLSQDIKTLNTPLQWWWRILIFLSTILAIYDTGNIPLGVGLEVVVIYLVTAFIYGYVMALFLYRNIFGISLIILSTVLSTAIFYQRIISLPLPYSVSEALFSPDFLPSFFTFAILALVGYGLGRLTAKILKSIENATNHLVWSYFKVICASLVSIYILMRFAIWILDRF